MALCSAVVFCVVVEGTSSVKYVCEARYTFLDPFPIWDGDVYLLLVVYVFSFGALVTFCSCCCSSSSY